MKFLSATILVLFFLLNHGKAQDSPVQTKIENEPTNATIVQPSETSATAETEAPNSTEKGILSTTGNETTSSIEKENEEFGGNFVPIGQRRGVKSDDLGKPKPSVKDQFKTFINMVKKRERASWKAFGLLFCCGVVFFINIILFVWNFGRASILFNKFNVVKNRHYPEKDHKDPLDEKVSPEKKETQVKPSEGRKKEIAKRTKNKPNADKKQGGPKKAEAKKTKGLKQGKERKTDPTNKKKKRGKKSKEQKKNPAGKKPKKAQDGKNKGAKEDGGKTAKKAAEEGMSPGEMELGNVPLVGISDDYNSGYSDFNSDLAELHSELEDFISEQEAESSDYSEDDDDSEDDDGSEGDDDTETESNDSGLDDYSDEEYSEEE